MKIKKKVDEKTSKFLIKWENVEFSEELFHFLVLNLYMVYIMVIFYNIVHICSFCVYICMCVYIWVYIMYLYLLYAIIQIEENFANLKWFMSRC